jgi:hypothetical protein
MPASIKYNVPNTSDVTIDLTIISLLTPDSIADPVILPKDLVESTEAAAFTPAQNVVSISSPNSWASEQMTKATSNKR